ncbi:MAG: hypothetical protein ACYCSA_02365 [Thermoplasmataceae archaeon]
MLHACLCTQSGWLSRKDGIPSGRREFKPMEIPPATFEVGSSLRDLGEEITVICQIIAWFISVIATAALYGIYFPLMFHSAH